MADTAEKVRENKARRVAYRLGYAVMKSRNANQRGYMIVDAKANTLVAGGHPIAFSFDLDDVETWLSEQQEPKKPRKKRR